MASSLSATTSASLVTKNATHLSHFSNKGISRVSFRISPNPKIRFFTKGLCNGEEADVCMARCVLHILKNEGKGLRTGQNCSTLVKAQLNEVSVDGSSNAAASSPTKSEVPPSDAADAKSSNEASPPALATEESISEFITQVSSLVKLVDSRDIVELQLKQLDCEVIIRKKEALPQPASSAPVYMMHSPPPPPVAPTAPSAASATASSPALSAPPPSSSPSAPKSAKSSRPPLKCPMAGTFYRSPAPGEPPFVKVGDKVQKGQVICIIEAMKLMNDIEADQSGTIVEILVDDGKPVSVDTPLFLIEP